MVVKLKKASSRNLSILCYPRYAGGTLEYFNIRDPEECVAKFFSGSRMLRKASLRQAFLNSGMTLRVRYN